MDRSKEDFDECYEILSNNVLGKGAFAFVFEAKPRKRDKINLNNVAVKIYLTDRCNAKLISNEIVALSSLSHPNIIQMHSFFKYEKYAYLVFEKIHGGELVNHILNIHARGISYNEHSIKAKCQSLLSALNCCHKNNIVHRDIKPENVLMVSREDDADIKLADFGLAVKIRPVDGKLHGAAGSMHYMAPEIIQNKPYDFSIDMWSLGVVIYVLLVGKLPFESDVKREYYRKAQNCLFDFPAVCKASTSAKDFVKKLIVLDPSKRMTAEAALQHPWVTQIHKVNDFKPLDVENLRQFNAARKITNAITVIFGMRRWFGRAKERIRRSNLERNRKIEHVTIVPYGAAQKPSASCGSSAISSGASSPDSSDAFSNLTAAATAASTSGMDALLYGITLLEQESSHMEPASDISPIALERSISSGLVEGMGLLGGLALANGMTITDLSQFNEMDLPNKRHMRRSYSDPPSTTSAGRTRTHTRTSKRNRDMIVGQGSDSLENVIFPQKKMSSYDRFKKGRNA